MGFSCLLWHHPFTIFLEEHPVFNLLDQVHSLAHGSADRKLSVAELQILPWNLLHFFYCLLAAGTCLSQATNAVHNLNRGASCMNEA